MVDSRWPVDCYGPWTMDHGLNLARLPNLLYILVVKVFIIFLFTLIALRSEAQVSLRSEFTVGKHTRKSGLGLSMITVGLGTRWSGMPGSRQALIIDLKALRNPDQKYSYRQLAERVYGLIPGIPADHFPQPSVPLFLLVEPPPKSFQRPIPTVRVRR
jgi:hypothetical protein